MRRQEAAPAGIGVPGAAPGPRQRRAVGQWGSAARVVVGAGLLVLAFAYWRAGWVDVVIGLVALPAVATLLMSLRKRTAPPLRLGAAGHLVTLAHIAVTVVLFGDAAALFYGSMTLVAGLQGNGGCEITTLANWRRGRDDQVGCPLFAPFDLLDRELARNRSAAHEDARL